MADKPKNGEVLPPSPVSSEARKPGSERAIDKALGPAAENFGQEVAPVGKRAGELTRRISDLLLRALEPAVYGLEKIADWIEKEVQERLKDVPPEKIVPPNPRVAVPAVQALVYSMEDESIRDMFANLLAADMNADTKRAAHPAFVEIIKQMSPQDARVFQVARSPHIEFVAGMGAANKWLEMGTHYTMDVEGVDDFSIAVSLDNLHRLGLLEYRDMFPIDAKFDRKEQRLRDSFKGMAEGLKNKEAYKTMGFLSPPQLRIRKRGVYITGFGVEFTKACILPARNKRMPPSDSHPGGVT
jgi:abortive infection alpha-like protein